MWLVIKEHSEGNARTPISELEFARWCATLQGQLEVFGSFGDEKVVVPFVYVHDLYFVFFRWIPNIFLSQSSQSSLSVHFNCLVDKVLRIWDLSNPHHFFSNVIQLLHTSIDSFTRDWDWRWFFMRKFVQTHTRRLRLHPRNRFGPGPWCNNRLNQILRIRCHGHSHASLSPMDLYVYCQG